MFLCCSKWSNYAASGALTIQQGAHHQTVWTLQHVQNVSLRTQPIPISIFYQHNQKTKQKNEEKKQK